MGQKIHSCKTDNPERTNGQHLVIKEDVTVKRHALALPGDLIMSRTVMNTENYQYHVKSIWWSKR